MYPACEHGLVFNGEKCEVKKDSVTFFGTVYDANGAHPDPKKVDAIHKMPPPDNKQQLQHFLGMVTYLSPFIPSLSTHTAPLQELLKKDSEFMWNPTYQEAFNQIQEIGLQGTHLQYFNVQKPITVQVDASKKGTWSCTPAKMPSCLCFQSSYPYRATIHQNRT